MGDPGSPAEHRPPHDIDPFVWLNDVLEKIVSGQVKADELYRLLVWNWKAERAE